MSTKRHRERQIDLVAAKKLRDELVVFAEEFDASDPVNTEVMLDTHLSTLVEDRLIKIKKKGNDLHLEDVLQYILKIREPDEVIENAQLFRTLISSYGGEPTEDDMEEAYDLLQGLIGTLNKVKGIDEPHGQARIPFE